MKVILIGKGKMASLIETTFKKAGHEILGMADAFDPAGLLENIEQADMIVDFSHRDNQNMVLEAALKYKVPVVEGTTALTDLQKDAIVQASKSIPIFFSSNYSLGVAMLTQLAREAAEVLKDEWDIEIVETHHNQKADAPSGTALSILEAVDPKQEFNVVYGRSPQSNKRLKEIGMHSLRGGSVPGTHEISFFGKDEILSCKHEALSRQIFVNGALKAAQFLEKQPAGLYSMDNLVEILRNK